jgi:hypothetical protein
LTRWKLDEKIEFETGKCGITRYRTCMFYQILEKLIRFSSVGGVKYTSMPDEVFRRLLAGAIRNKGIFDEKFYLETYADIRDAVRGGKVASGLEHYISTGYFESRMPARLVVDERFYLRENPDVADAIKNGRIESAQLHFDAVGFGEGRSPYKGFSMF